VGSEVLRKNNRRSDRKGGKKEDPWLGPYTVASVNNNGTYKLSNAGRMLKIGVNASQLKPYTIK
jgi:hypothetical protein